MRTAAQLLTEHLHLLTTNLNAWRDLYTEDAVMEYPYGSFAGVPVRLTGIAEIFASIEAFMRDVKDLRIDPSVIFKVEGEDAVFAEFRAGGTVSSTGRQYQQDYIVYLRAKDGKIVFLREYFDAPRVAAAFSPLTV
jgi:hypothetical protein